jgi:hypothetical protein
MQTGIFLIQDDGQLLELSESPYESEALLQELLERYPKLLAGDQFDPERPRRWLLVKREFGIPDGENLGDRWSVDHLFLDQDAIPTLVEVKRSSDTRIRREVVGQMLDYAANAVAYWPAERLQFEFEATAEATGRDGSAVLQEFLGADAEPAEFWANAKTNMQAGRLRLVFVADKIPTELRRIIEFLNRQMDPTEVLGVEIPQFVGAGVRSLVPRVVGRTVESELRKGGVARGKQWDEKSFFEMLAQRPEVEVRVARRIIAWASDSGLRLWWGKGVKNASFYPMLDHAARVQYTVGVFAGYKSAYVILNLPDMVKPFDEEEMREKLITRLRDGCGWVITSDQKYPSLHFDELVDASKLEGLLDTLDWVIAETRACP